MNRRKVPCDSFCGSGMFLGVTPDTHCRRQTYRRADARPSRGIDLVVRFGIFVKRRAADAGEMRQRRLRLAVKRLNQQAARQIGSNRQEKRAELRFQIHILL